MLLALFAGWWGTFPGGATFAGALGGAVGLFVALLLASPSWRDPLGLQVAALVPLLWAAVAVSTWLSPVPRAGWVALILLPAYLGTPGMVAHSWSTPGARRLGTRTLAVVVLGIAVWSLVDRFLVAGSGRTAMPLGHHTLLAAWLVLAAPVGLSGLGEPGRWRWLARLLLLVTAVALLLTGSLGGVFAGLFEAALALAWWSRRPGPQSPAGRPPFRRWAPVAGLGLLASLIVVLPRLVRLAQSADLSWRLRLGYLAGAWRGFEARPLLGWGAGASAWTVPEFLHPTAGANPWGEAVGELHSLPAQLAYELGALGLLVALALVAAFLWRRRSELRDLVRSERPGDADLVVAGLIALAGGAIIGLTTGALRVTSLPFAAAVAAGAAMSGRPFLPLPRDRIAGGAYVLIAALCLLTPLRAELGYERAAAAAQVGDTDRARAEIAGAAELDPRFPLYPFRLALAGASGTAPAAAAARTATLGAPGVPLFWLAAGILGREVGEDWSGAALSRAGALDPLDPFPAFYAMARDPQAPAAAGLGALALVADPRLAAATFWEGREPLFRQVIDRIAGWRGIEPGWREALLAAAPRPAERTGPTVRLSLDIDLDPALAFSPHLFRRRPWPTQWPLITLRRELLGRLALPPATTRLTTRLDTPLEPPAAHRSP